VVSWLGYVIGSSKTSARRDVKGALRLTAVDEDDWLYARLVGDCIDLVAHRQRLLSEIAFLGVVLQLRLRSWSPQVLGLVRLQYFFRTISAVLNITF
jgi:hypothetical protein